MSIQRILVPLRGDAQDVTALDIAYTLAGRFSSHVDALHVQAAGETALPFLGDTTSGAVIEEIIDRIEEEAEKRAQKVTRQFEEWCRNSSIQPTDKLAGIHPSVRFTNIKGDRDRTLASAARCSDLIILRPASEENIEAAAETETVLMESGRPVLIAPKAVAAGFANKVIVAWNDSVESARALAAAMPFITRADAVTIATVSDKNGDAVDLNPVSDLLKTHGVEASTIVIDADGEETSDVLTQHARRHVGALLVMGAYSHSRFKEQIFGGVTQDVLDFTEVPTLLIH